MKKILAVLLIANMLFLAGCSKEDGGAPTAGDAVSFAVVSEPKDGVVTISGIGPMADAEQPKGYDEYEELAKERAGIESVVIEEGVTAIGKNAFYGYEDLREVTIPSSVKTIGEYAFYSTKLSDVVIPTGVTEIGYGAFSGCTKLISIEIPEGVEKIDINAFRECGALTSVRVPDSVTSLEAYVFGDCVNLETLYIGKSVKSVDETAFINCDSLKEILVSEENPYFVSVDGVLYTKDMKELVTYPFRREASTYEVPAGVAVIRQNAFFGEFTAMENTFGAETEVLRTLILPEGVTTLADMAFTQDGIEAIHIPESVNKIDISTFSYTSAVLYGKPGSYAEEFAKQEGRTFIAE